MHLQLFIFKNKMEAMPKLKFKFLMSKKRQPWLNEHKGNTNNSSSKEIIEKTKH